MATTQSDEKGLHGAAAVDPIVVQLIRGSLKAARQECEILIERTSMSAFIREKKDYLISFCDSQGKSVYGADQGSDLIDCVWDYYPSETMRPGDLYWYNDPYISDGAISHSPDMVFITPVFYDGDLVAYCYSWAHFWDMGGSRPGSIGPANTEIFHDGTLVPPVKIVKEGVLNDEAYRIILRNSRYPDLLEGDTQALMAAAALAEKRLVELFDRFGKETVLTSFNMLQEETGRFVRDKMLELVPEGEYSFRDYMDSDGVGNEWHSLHVKLTRKGDHVVADTTASGDQAPGSINFLMSKVVLKSWYGLYFASFDPSLLMNQGMLSAVDDVHIRDGSILHPRWPAALGCRAHTFGKLKEAIIGTIAQATGGDVMAASAVYVIAYWRMKDPETGQWVLCTDGIAVGHGARPFADGLDAIYNRHNQNYPAEFMDMEYPLRVERYALHPDSGGPGKYRGGCGIIRDVRLLSSEGTFGLRVECNRFPAWGVAGGMAGGTSRVALNPGTPGEQEVRPFSDDNRWYAGDLVRIYSAGGGGWGDPLERDVTLVEQDVRGGFVTPEGALRSYGVLIDPNSITADVPGSVAMRIDFRKARGKTKMFHRFIYFDTEEEEREWVEQHMPR